MKDFDPARTRNPAGGQDGPGENNAGSDADRKKHPTHSASSDGDFSDAAVFMWEDEFSTPGRGNGEPPRSAGKPYPDDGRERQDGGHFDQVSLFLPGVPDDMDDVPPQAFSPHHMHGQDPPHTGEPETGTPFSNESDETGLSDSAEPFFPIPDEIPDIPVEETEDIRDPKPRSGVLMMIVNVMLCFALLLVTAAVGAGLIYYKYATERLYGKQDAPERLVVVTINPGDSFPKIVERLRSEHLIDSYMGIDDKYLMRYLAWLNENSHLIKSGAYRLNATMGLSEIYDKMIKGSQDFKITIPEGRTTREIAEIVRKQNEYFDAEKFVQLAGDASFISRLGLNVPSLEGYLYPNTYYFGPGMKEEDLIRLMVKTFQESVERQLDGVQKQDDYTFHKHVIMASLIEREARIEADRPLIASVIFNRLKKKMPLQIDASVLFALEDWTHSLTYSDLKVDSPYNTYKYAGLPPGPICNPRASSIAATFDPAETDFLFYVYKGDGSHAFAKEFEEHKANVRLYLRSRPEVIDVSEKKGSADKEALSKDDAETSEGKPANAGAGKKGATATDDEDAKPDEKLEKAEKEPVAQSSPNEKEQAKTARKN